jgi:hypothetical protein
MRAATFVVLTVAVISAGIAEGDQKMTTTGCHAITLLDLNNPLPPEWLAKAGIDYVYVSGGIPVENGPDGRPVIAAKQRDLWERALKLYEGTGVKVLLMSQFYTREAEDTQAVDFFGRAQGMACYRQPGFQQWMREAIVSIAQAFGKYPAFGGFMFDDGVQVRVDCCYCDLCQEQFREQYGIEPPPFEVHEGTGRIADDDALLAWEEFQRESFEIYLRTQSEAVRSVSDDLLMVTIPSDAYYCGRFLNVEVKPEDSRLGAGALLQRIERIHPRHWQMFYTFPMARLPEATERGLQRWAIGCHITAHSARIMSQPEGPYAPIYGRQQYMSPGEISRMARVNITEGANAACYWTGASSLPYYPQAFDALAGVNADVSRVEELLTQRRPLPANVGLVYSTTTEIFEQPWAENTNERWQHLHAFEGLAYSLRRANVPFDVILEDEITPERLGRLDALVLPATRFLTNSAARAIERVIAMEGLQVFTAGECAPLVGAVATDCDPHVFRRWAIRGYRQEERLNRQWAEVRATLLPHLLPLVKAPVRIHGDSVIGQTHRLEDGTLLTLVTNWDLHESAAAVIEGSGQARDALTGEKIGDLAQARTVTVAPAGWRIIRVER